MNMHNPTCILVTGASGFIGTNFIYYMQKHLPKIHLINLDKMTYAAKQITNVNRETYTEYQGDICNLSFVEGLLRKYKIQTIINFAAESHVDRSISHPLIFAETNVLGTASLLEAARKYWFSERKLSRDECRFYQISTDEVFGSLAAEEPPSDEKHQYEPRSPYSASKASADHFVQAYFHTYNLPVVISHCGNNYGPYQHSEKFIPTIIQACLDQKPIPVYGNGSNIRDWIYVEDHCEAIFSILTHGKIGEIYNVGASNEMTNNQIVDYICSVMDVIRPQQKPHAKLIRYVQDRQGHDWRYALDTSKIRQALNWHAKTSFDRGIHKTVEFFLEKAATEAT